MPLAANDKLFVLSRACRKFIETSFLPPLELKFISFGRFPGKTIISIVSLELRFYPREITRTLLRDRCIVFF